MQVLSGKKTQGKKTAGKRIERKRIGAAAFGAAAFGRLLALGAALALAVTAGNLIAEDDSPPKPATTGTVPNPAPARLASGDLDRGVKELQRHLEARPKDYASWASLGTAYVEQARVNADPSRYPQAERALTRSLELRPANDPALAGRAALASARHDFHGALRLTREALAVNPYSEAALALRVDALVELGHYKSALKAAETADSRRPGIPAFTRFSYVHELRGDATTARKVLTRALTSATAPGDVSYVATALGQLAWRQGAYKTSLRHYATALRADPNAVAALEGRGRARAASGDTAGAIRDLKTVVERAPLPTALVELGELYEARGDTRAAKRQYALVGTWLRLTRAGGVDVDLDTALASAEHGDRAAGLKAARAEWRRRHTVHTADALAWALHANGRDKEALPYARRATATGFGEASFLYHRGVLELSVGDRSEGRALLREALDRNPGFSPLGAKAARAALAKPTGEGASR
ncbi:MULTISPECIES: lipopolysaccharide assembly protein LapB [unclassified Streptomyces]|uniref:tetratricopeptide repeat protein n=1 Tax=unclassified Streptomyces TaxID=2593676 RepID=UPI00278C26DC|nr:MULTISPECIES: tetratricopeptide repeat protein [unclassified Streptomyces]